ncbi:DUF4062 domain-containing protein [Cohnella sp. GCM10027633]|uniref:DUF4062 domain-containing protein n=1 Tax=unclassified Cohnella TaxID=2636738 RepID=UPI003633D93B
MARPRVFISSTFYDLKQVRENIDTFINSLGYIPIRNEEGQIPYGNDDVLDQDCYDEVENCDIFVSIIGSRFGSESSYGRMSISQKELETAIYLNKQIYIFIDKNVQAEYETYKLNKNLKSMKWRHVDDRRIYEYLDELNELDINKPMFAFETSKDIITKLQEQWSGLFQKLLKTQEERIRFNVVEKLEDAAEMFHRIADYFVERDTNRDASLSQMLKTNHPAFVRLGEVINVSYKIVFLNVGQLNQYLSNIGFKLLPNSNDDQLDEYINWAAISLDQSERMFIRIAKKLFDSSWDLVYISNELWADHYIILNVEELQAAVSKDSEEMSY